MKTSRTHPAHIGVYTAASIAIANMVGTGVFTSLGFQVIGIQSVFALVMWWVAGSILYYFNDRFAPTGR